MCLPSALFLLLTQPTRHEQRVCVAVIRVACYQFDMNYMS